MATPHVATVVSPYVKKNVAERELVLHHYYTRSFLRFMHRGIRGDVITGLHARRRGFLLYLFTSRMLEFNALQDRSLVSFADEVIRHLGSLNLWGTDREHRLRPYSILSPMEVELLPDWEEVEEKGKGGSHIIPHHPL